MLDSIDLRAIVAVDRQEYEHTRRWTLRDTMPILKRRDSLAYAADIMETADRHEKNGQLTLVEIETFLTGSGHELQLLFVGTGAKHGLRLLEELKKHDDGFHACIERAVSGLGVRRCPCAPIASESSLIGRRLCTTRCVIAL